METLFGVVDGFKMKKILFAILVVLCLSIPTIVAEEYTPDYTLQNGEKMILECKTTTDDVFYEIENQNGLLAIIQLEDPNPDPDPEPNGTWSSWSGYWCIGFFDNPEPTVNFVTHSFGGSVTVEEDEPEPEPEPKVSYVRCLFGGRVIVEEEPSDCEIDLETSWNQITSPVTINKNDIQVRYNNRVYSWKDAYRNRITHYYIYDMQWQRVNTLYEGEQYQLYAYKPCTVIFC